MDIIRIRMLLHNKKLTAGVRKMVGRFSMAESFLLRSSMNKIIRTECENRKTVLRMQEVCYEEGDV